MNSTTLDLAIRIKNGYMGGKRQIQGLYSKMNADILAILKKRGYIAGFSTNLENGLKSFTIDLKYDNDVPAFTEVKIHSRPGRRVYKAAREIPSVLGGLGMAVITTSKGVMTDEDARKAKLGGELIFELW